MLKGCVWGWGVYAVDMLVYFMELGSMLVVLRKTKQNMPVKKGEREVMNERLILK